MLLSIDQTNRLAPRQPSHHQSLQPICYTYRNSEDDLLKQQNANKLRANSHDCTPSKSRHSHLNHNNARLSVSSCRGDYTKQQQNLSEQKKFELSLLDSASLGVRSNAANRLSIENFQKRYPYRHSSNASNTAISLFKVNNGHQNRPSQTTTEFCPPENRPDLDALGYTNWQRRYTRRSSNWSRLSVSGNIDLRRVIRLWSTTNPYNNRRSSGSLSNRSYNVSAKILQLFRSKLCIDYLISD